MRAKRPKPSPRGLPSTHVRCHGAWSTGRIMSSSPSSSSNRRGWRSASLGSCHSSNGSRRSRRLHVRANRVSWRSGAGSGTTRGRATCTAALARSFRDSRVRSRATRPRFENYRASGRTRPAPSRASPSTSPSPAWTATSCGFSAACWARMLRPNQGTTRSTRGPADFWPRGRRRSSTKRSWISAAACARLRTLHAQHVRCSEVAPPAEKDPRNGSLPRGPLSNIGPGGVSCGRDGCGFLRREEAGCWAPIGCRRSSRPAWPEHPISSTPSAIDAGTSGGSTAGVSLRETVVG